MNKPIKLRADEVLPCELSDDELRACIEEARRRSLCVTRVDAEGAHEALLEGRSEIASAMLSQALFPNGADIIKSRVEAHKREAIRKNRKAA